VRWTACASPYTTARLTAGKHLFEVRAISPAGVTDPMGARRSFEVQPAASIEEHSCIRAVWEGASLGGALFGGKGTMDCYLPFSCPQWYDCVLSGSLTFSFAMPADKAAYINVPQEVYAALFVDKDAQQHQVSCVPLGESYPQSGETRYCSRAGQITIHGQSLAEAAGRPGPSVSCIAATFVAIDPGDWFNSQILGCDAIIRRTWAPGVAHAHPLINLVRTGRNVFASSRAALFTGFAASCPAGGGTCAANVIAALRGAARAGAASTQRQSTPPEPPGVPQAPLMGRSSLKIRSGKRARVTFSLTRRGARLLHQRHRLRITLTITTPPARLRGRDTVIKRTLTIVDRH
jgi:hypothetical protein